MRLGIGGGGRLLRGGVSVGRGGVRGGVGVGPLHVSGGTGGGRVDDIDFIRWIFIVCAVGMAIFLLLLTGPTLAVAAIGVAGWRLPMRAKQPKVELWIQLAVAAALFAVAVWLIVDGVDRLFAVVEAEEERGEDASLLELLTGGLYVGGWAALVGGAALGVLSLVRWQEQSHAAAVAAAAAAAGGAASVVAGAEAC